MADLKPGDCVRMYRGVIEVTAPWHVPDDEQFRPGWGRLPMVWDGIRCAPPEMGETEVEVVPCPEC